MSSYASDSLSFFFCSGYSGITSGDGAGVAAYWYSLMLTENVNGEAVAQPGKHVGEDF